jgi:hypothetical protein
MSKIGQLRIDQPIEKAMREIRDWLSKLNINGLSINTNYDARMNIAVLKFKYQEKDYEFRSTKQANCRLNMWGIARVMEYKVRASIMGIEDFEKAMQSYLALEDKSGSSNFTQQTANEKSYIVMGLTPLASNEEIKQRHKDLMKTWHPDFAGSEGAKKEFEKRCQEINEAYAEIKKERSFT